MGKDAMRYFNVRDHEHEMAEAKKGTWRGETHPGQRHREEAKPGDHHLVRKGQQLCTLSPAGANQSREERQGGRAREGRRRRNWAGKPL